MTINSKIRKLLEAITEKLRKSFQENFKCLILYGSWAKGIARKDSDIDLLVVFKKVNGNTSKLLYKIETDAEREKSVTLVPTIIEDFVN
jgi:predicted nucleotidyltransferase